MRALAFCIDDYKLYMKQKGRLVIMINNYYFGIMQTFFNPRSNECDCDLGSVEFQGSHLHISPDRLTSH